MFRGLLGDFMSGAPFAPPQQQARTILQLAMAPGPIALPMQMQYPLLWSGEVPAPTAAAVAPAETVDLTVEPSPVVVRLPPNKSARLCPSAEDAASRTKVLDTWLGILTKLGPATKAFDLCDGVFTEDKVKIYFASKSTGTLANRASAWCMFLRFAESIDSNPEHFDEPQAYQYLLSLSSDAKCSATRSSSFMSGCNFLLGTCGLKAGSDIAASGRCKGAAATTLAERRLAKQRDPLKAAWLISAEEEVVLAYEGDGQFGRLTEPEAIMLGFLVFCTHARSRCSDTARICLEPVLDEVDCDPLCSFIEATAVGGHTKTGQTVKKARMAVPMVGLSRGLSDTPWAKSWLKLREAAGLRADRDECLQRDLLLDGTFGEGRLQPGQATIWLRFLLTKIGVQAEQLSNIGSHSCKVTLLSMAAKAGLARDDRRTLGGHTSPNDRSVDIYSRDLLSAPLRSLALLLRDVREGAFQPDASRSGRWWRTVTADVCVTCSGPLSDSVAFECDCGNKSHCGCAVKCGVCLAEFCSKCDLFLKHWCREPETVAQKLLEESDPEWDTDDDSDCEQARMALESAEDLVAEETLQQAFLEKGATAEDAKMPPSGIFVHLTHRTAHKAGSDGATACGVLVSDLSHEFLSGSDDFTHARLCWRCGCAPWEKEVPVSSSDSEVELWEDGPLELQEEGEREVAPGSS